jgi:hypothetical protein
VGKSAATRVSDERLLKPNSANLATVFPMVNNKPNGATFTLEAFDREQW